MENKINSKKKVNGQVLKTWIIMIQILMLFIILPLNKSKNDGEKEIKQKSKKSFFEINYLKYSHPQKSFQ